MVQAGGKDYPWRRTEDPWHILVSELMLQQTTIPTVLGRYELWMRRFPTPHHLAAVDEQTALRSWEGLGYYRRVRSLQAIAREIVTSFGGTFPSDKEGLKKLPGIGPYTSGALLSFAFNKPAPIVDANVARVLSRIDNYSTAVDSTEGLKYLWARAEELVDPDHAREFNSAIMELGQTYCRISAPDCLLCPVRSFCTAERPETLPVKIPSRKSRGRSTTTSSTSAINPSCCPNVRKANATRACTASPSGTTTTRSPCPIC